MTIIKTCNYVYGVGINDIPNSKNYVDEKGVRVRSKYYAVWSDMLRRCYSDKFFRKQPTYKECSVCKDWLTFSNFKVWMEKQDWKGKCLDKDIVHLGNKIYSPENCVFVSGALNNLFTDNRAIRGKYPIGVCYNKIAKRFMSYCNVNGKQKSLGYFDTPEEAANAYIACKVNHVKSIAENYKHDERIYNGLIAYCETKLNHLTT